MIEKFSTIKDLLYNQVSEIIAGALYYQHKYFLIDNQINYEKDGDNDDISFGYKTMFANIYEYQQENISSSHLNKVLCIELKAA